MRKVLNVNIFKITSQSNKEVMKNILIIIIYGKARQNALFVLQLHAEMFPNK